MPYTLAEAAAACGLDKSTIRRAVRSGRISGTRDESGMWHVEPVELHRVFPPAPRTEDDTTAVPLHAPSDAATDILVAELRAVIRAGERREEDLREERDRWRTAFENTQRLLSPPIHQGAPAATHTALVPATPAEQPSRLRRAWRWMRAAG
jgi:Helix-turn-helix domain